MYCPKCGTKYREGIFKCADCGVPLVPDLLPEAHNGPDLDALIETNMFDPVAIELVKSLFDECGIPFFVMDQSLIPRQEAGNWLGWIRIRVPHEREAEAREILESIAHAKDAEPEA